MCGIAGVIQYKSKLSREQRQKALRILFSELMLKTETRGRDATGLYQVMADGDWLMTKKAQKAEEWLFQDREEASCKDPYVYGDIVASWSESPQELKTVIGHCRARTVGTVENQNNHPFAIQVDEHNALLGVHNGTLYNHERIFDRLPKVVERQGKVDSEAIFHLLFHLTDYGTKPITPEIIQHLGVRLDGAYACVVVNTRFPNQIVTFRDTRPLEFFMVWPLNVILLASEKKFVESALEKYDFVRRLVDPSLPALQAEDRTLMDRDYRIFDASKEFPPPPVNKYNYQEWTKISETKEFRKNSEAVKEDWKDPNNPKPKKIYGTGTSHSTSSSASGASGSAASRFGGGSAASAAGSAAKTSKPTSTPGVKALPAKTGEGNSDRGIEVEAKVVEIELGSEGEAQKAYEQVGSLGACVHYDSEREVAVAVGKTEEELKTMSPVLLANALSKPNFTLGYAMGRVDSRNEVASTRTKGKSLVRKLEESEERLAKSEEKNKRARNHVWSYKAIVQIMLALSTAGYPLNLKNLTAVVRAFPKLTVEKRQEVSEAVRGILESKDTIDLVSNLHEEFSKMEQERKRKRETKEKEEQRVV